MTYRTRDSEVSLCVKYVLFSFNLLFWLMGGVICCVGLWARVEYANASNSIGIFSGWSIDPAVIFIVVGGVMFLLAFCGCVGALRENICLLKFFSICLSIIFFVEIATGIIGFIFRHKIKSLLEKKLGNTIVNYRNNDNLQDIIDYSQITFKCCGLSSYRDWRRNVYFNCTQKGMEACSVPYSCCKTDQLNTLCGYKANSEGMSYEEREKVIYTQGCINGITQWFETHLQIIGGLAFAVALLQVIGIAFATVLIKGIRRQMEKWESRSGSVHEPLHSNDM